jgi:endonuclease YncB( thermonuclease family)
MKIAVIAFVVCLAGSPAQAADLSGVPRVVDGDTLAIGATKVRLNPSISIILLHGGIRDF